MNLNKLISIFNNNGGSLKKEDLTDSSKKNDPAVKSILNIFDTDLNGSLDASELALIDKFNALDGDNTSISINDLKLFSSLSGSLSDFTFGDLSLLKTNRYSSENNTLNVFNGNNKKTSTTTINDDGSVTKTLYSFDNSVTTIEYTSDYRMKSKTVTRTTGAHEEYQYNDAGKLIQKNITLKDGSQTKTSYREDGKITLLVKNDTKGAFVSSEEYDYDENGRKTTSTSYDAAGNIVGKTLYSADGQIRVKYDANGEIIQRDTFNKYSKPLTTFTKNADGSTASGVYEYPKAGGSKATIITYDSNGVQLSQQIITTDDKGNKTVYTDGVLVQKDEVASDKTVTSTVYKSKDVIDSVTTKNSRGTVTKVDYYTYNGANIDTITEKDANGVVIGTGQYHYDDTTVIKYLDHFDASGKLLDKAVWNLDGTKTTILYNATMNGLSGTLTDNYGTNDKLDSSEFVASSGEKLSSVYAYDTPSTGDTTVTSEEYDSQGVKTNVLVSITHSNGTVENNLYNADKSQLLENNTSDKYGNIITTVYANNQITSVTKISKAGKITSQDNYTYTDGVLSSIQHIGSSGTTTGTTLYDADGNTQEFDSAGRVTSTKTTNKTTGALTTETYTYLSTGDKVVKTTVTLNSQVQSVKKVTTHLDNSVETVIYDSTGKNILQKDIVSADGKTTSNIYDLTTHKLTRVVNKDASGNIILINEYTYATNGSIDHIDCYDANNKLTQTITYLQDDQKSITNYDANGTFTTIYDKDGNVVSVK